MRCFRSLRTETVLALVLCSFSLLFLLLSLHTAPAPAACPRGRPGEPPGDTRGAVTWPPPPARPPPAPCRANASAAQLPDFAEQPPHVRDFLLHRHCRAFPLLQDAPLSKCAQPVFLLLVIKSSPGNYERRELVRRTWGREREVQGVPLRRLFLVGTAPEPKEARKVNQLLAMEARAHGDILQWDFHDSFFNLTLKQVGWRAAPVLPAQVTRVSSEGSVGTSRPVPPPYPLYCLHGARSPFPLGGGGDPGLNSGSVLPLMMVRPSVPQFPHQGMWDINWTHPPLRAAVGIT